MTTVSVVPLLLSGKPCTRPRHTKGKGT